jgi:uncharacterized membrane protein YdfJ with MMPL/SSD domain
LFQLLGSFINRFKWWILLGGIIFIVAAATYGTTVFSRLDSGGFTSSNFESYQASQEVSDHFGGQQSIIVLFSSYSGLQATDPQYEAAVLKTLEIAHQNPNVSGITDYYNTHSPALISRNHTQTYAIVNVSGTASAAGVTTAKLRPLLTSNILKVQTGGELSINEDFNTQISKDLAKAETISFILLAILLLFVFRGFVAAPLPLLLGAFGVLGAFLALRLLTNVMIISQYAINVIILLGLGLSIDYSLFMVSRFREELRHNSSAEALLITMKTAGRTVFFSGLTVILSLVGLLVFPINFLQSMGVGASAAVAVAMLGALTILPALLSILGNKVNAFSFGSVRADYQAIKNKSEVAAAHHSVWYRVAKIAMWRPVLTIGVIVIPLVFFGQYFLQAQFSTADYRSLPMTSQSRMVSVAMNNNFPGGGSNPIQIVAHSSTSVTSASNISKFQSYIRYLNTLPGVTGAAESISGNYVLINVSYNSGYDELLARDLVKDIRNGQHPVGWSIKVGGLTAQLVDLLASIAHYAVYAGAIVAIALFLLLLFMFRSIVVPLEALFVNILSLSATFGLLVWIFQYGHLSRLLGFTSLGSIDATQPVLIFGIAFGLSMDYSVFLFSRIKEQYDQDRDVVQSIASGLDKTGPIITSAAILFIVVVAAFATSVIPLIKQIGVGLALAVFMDAFLVRMLLIPAFMRLFGRANWWAPNIIRSRVASPPSS